MSNRTQSGSASLGAIVDSRNTRVHGRRIVVGQVGVEVTKSATSWGSADRITSTTSERPVGTMLAFPRRVWVVASVHAVALAN